MKTETWAKLKIAERSVSTSQRANVTVTVSPRGDRPTGTVTVNYGSRSTTVTLKKGDRGQVTLALPKLKKGEYAVSATYDGSDTFAGDTSNTITLRVR